MKYAWQHQYQMFDKNKEWVLQLDCNTQLMEYDALNRQLLNPKTVLNIVFLFQPVTKELSEEVDE